MVRAGIDRVMHPGGGTVAPAVVLGASERPTFEHHARHGRSRRDRIDASRRVAIDRIQLRAAAAI